MPQLNTSPPIPAFLSAISSASARSAIDAVSPSDVSASLSASFASSSQAEALTASNVSIIPSLEKIVSLTRRERKKLNAPKFRSKLGSGIASLLVFGDSYGQFVFPTAQAETDVLWQLWRTYGFRGVWLGLSASNVPGFGTGLAGGAIAQVAKDFSLLPNGDVFSLPSPGAAIGFSATVPGTEYAGNKLTAVYKIQTGGGTMKWQTRLNKFSAWVDGATIDTSVGTNGSVGTTSITWTKDASFESQLIVVTGATVVAGALLEDTTATVGVIVTILARGGLDLTGQANTMPQANLAVLLGVMVPDLIVQTFADSDISVSFTAQYALWQGARAAQDWIYVAPSFGNTDDVASAGDIRNNAIIDFAIANGQEYWDMRQCIRNYALAVANGLMGDVTHLNGFGINIVAEEFWNDFGVLKRQNSVTSQPIKTASVDARKITLRGNVLTDLMIAQGRAGIGAGGIIAPAAAASLVGNVKSMTSVGTGPFAIAAWRRFEATVGGNNSIFAIMPTNARTNQAGGIFANLATDGAIKIDWFQGTTSDFMRITLAAASIAPYLNKTCLFGFRRTANNDIIITINDQVIIPNQVSASGAGVISGSLTVGSNFSWFGYHINTAGASSEILATAFWNTDTDPVSWFTSGAVPATPAYFYALREGGGGQTLDLSGSGNHGEVFGNWRRPVCDGVTTLTANATLAVNSVYLINKASTQCVCTLPTTARVGDFIEIRGLSTNGWRVSQATGHQIVEGAGTTIGTNSTTAGTSGNIQSGARYDTVILRCVVSDSITPSYIWTVVRNGAITWA